MYSLMNALCITLLFSVWVWILKNEVGQLQEKLCAGETRNRPPGPNDDQPHREPQRHSRGTEDDGGRAARHRFDKATRTRNTGVNTWTIE